MLLSAGETEQGIKTMARLCREIGEGNKRYGSKWITKEKRLAIYMRDNFLCCYCGRQFITNETGREITLDHIIPRNNGGNNKETNLITACVNCNSARQDKSIEDYAPGGAITRITEQTKKPLNILMAKDIIRGKANDKIESLR